jgi:hypothetical protein
MDYLYENLGDERFQEFCTVMIAKEFPNLQAFPVGQPDGGRDALSFIKDSLEKDFIVFQVKFVRNPRSIHEPHKWLIKILKDEIPKIEHLIPRGAKEFYLLTNVSGTAHLDAGSIDNMNAILEKNISIPAQCWWREDISRRFEGDPMFKWSFPEILNGQDILNSLIFQNINENREKREAIINAYLSDQYKMDNEVKFRQIDLQNKLIDLYADVPLRVKEFNRKNKNLRKILEILNISNRRIFEDDNQFHGREENIGAAFFLLNPSVQNGIERILLEGGPGQGKSTISQYICQVHRARLLNKTDDLKVLPSNFLGCPVRIPFKIDLRHIALWVEKKNPYTGSLSDETFNKIWQNKLESFIAGNIIYHSSIDDFNTFDLVTVIKNSSVLLVFDGFDEIADMKVRQAVIKFIDDGIDRIRINSKSLQVIITSRPAAFSNAIGFPVNTYPHFELTDITFSCIEEYMEKWIKANNLDSREGNEIRKLIDEKLQIPHLQELAKSPMQLAIFISLLRTRGESLPNKRTALYDSYIDLFFNREAEKSQIIRDNRDLIIDIHKYLAWILHSEAELYNNNGCITLDHLIERLKKYLEKEGHATDIAEILFQVVKERVCALVSRVQGTYEFEVQPLREYFCAKYLYQTAPYSPVGKEKSGTKPERFNTIARNFYWNNVVRFYAGCFDKGELPMLVDELKDLQNDDLLKYTNYPKLLTSQLLSDWVFSQSPKFLKDVVKIVIDGINIGNILNQSHQFFLSDEPIMLPDECGRAEIIKECFEQLKHFPHNDYAMELIGLIVNNKSEEVLELWENELKVLTSENILHWLEYGYSLEIIHKINNDILLNTVLQDENISIQEQKIQIIIRGNRFDVINHNIKLKEIALEGILSGNILALPRRRKFDSSLQLLSILLYPYAVSSIIYDTESKNVCFIDHLYSRFRLRYISKEEYENDLNKKAIFNDNIDKNIRKLYDDISDSLNSNLIDWKRNINKWDIFIEKLREIFGDKWAFKVLSTIIAGIKDKNPLDNDYSSLSDSSLSLCKRARYARSKSGDANYWERELSQTDDLLFIYLMFFTWATPKVIIKLYNKIKNISSKLSENEIQLLSVSLNKVSKQREINNLQTKELIEYLKKQSLSLELKYLLSFKLPEKLRDDFICSQNNGETNIFETDFIKAKFESLVVRYVKNANDRNLLDQIKKYYKYFSNYNINHEYLYSRLIRLHYENNSINIPLNIAQDIMKDPLSYPRIIASMAEKNCRLYANEKNKIVGKVASEKKWFD